MVMEVINVNYKQHEVGAVSFDTSKGLGFLNTILALSNKESSYRH